MTGNNLGCRPFFNRHIEINKMMSMIVVNTALQHLMKNPKRKSLFEMEFNSSRFWFKIYSRHFNRSPLKLVNFAQVDFNP